MATITFLKSKSQAVSTMRRVIDYCQREDKTYDPISERRLISGVNCNGLNAMTEFAMTKRTYGKTDGRNYYHYIQSFDSYDTISAEKAHALAVEFAARAWPGHEVLVCTHCDTDNPHSHFVINSVGYETGKKLRQNPNTLKELRHLSDEICIAHGYETLEPYQDGGANLSSREFRAAAKNQSWKINLMREINEIMEWVGGKDEFVQAMQERGYEMTWTSDRKYISFHCPNGRSCRDIKLHDEKYWKEKLEHEFAIRKQITEEFYAGQAGQFKRRSREQDRSYALRDAALRDSEGAAGRGVSFAAGGMEVPAGAVQEGRDAGNDGGSGRIQFADGETSGAKYTDGGEQTVRNESGNDNADAEPYLTGWEAAREVYLRRLQGFGFQDRGIEWRDPAAEENRSLVYDRDHDLFRHPLGAGVGALAAAVGLIEDDSEDPEEHRRRIEAKAHGQNLGAALGLAAGVIIGAAERQRRSEEERELSEEELEGPVMGGMV